MRTLAFFFSLGLLTCHTAATTDDRPMQGARPESDLFTWHPLPDLPPVPHPRHEAAFVRADNHAYLLGGRGIKPADRFDLGNLRWYTDSSSLSPVEIHHFQPVAVGTEVYLLGAMTGPYPSEDPLPNIHIYDTRTDTWRTGPEIPADRRRGGAGAILYDGGIYLVCGIQDGHRGGHVPWLDRFDLATGEWTRLADAPRPRDHFQAVVHDGLEVIAEVDVYKIATDTWTTLPEPLPTPRAGNAATVHNGCILVIGGESTAHEVAHNEVEALDPGTGKWESLPPLSRGRHGTGVVHRGDALLTASGCGNRGGTPELDDVIVGGLSR